MPHPSKRRLNFSSRTLFIAVTILAILLASSGNRVLRELQERRTKSEIQRLGGRFDCRHAVSLTANGWPSRFMSLMLFEDFARVTGVSLDRTKIQDGDLAILASLSGLEGLDISNTAITDAGLVHIAAIPHLKYVNAHHARLTEAGVAKLKSSRPSLLVDWR